MSTRTYAEYIESVKAITENAKRDIAKIAADKTLNQSYKQERIATIRRETKDVIESYRDECKASKTSRIAELQSKVNHTPTPPAAEAGLYDYALRALQVRWASMSAMEMRADWKAVIAAKDTVQARIYRDFAAPVWQAKNGGRPDAAPFGEEWKKFISDSEALVLSPDALAARDALGKIESEHTQFLIATGTARAELDNVQLNHDGSAAVTVNPLAESIRSAF